MKNITIVFIFFAITFMYNSICSSEDVEVDTENTNVLNSFIVVVADLNPSAGDKITVVVVAKDENGNTVTNYKGEGFTISGGSAAPDGTEPEYEAEGEGWDEGVIWYKVTLYRAGGPVKIVAEDGGVRSESGDMEVRTGIEDEIAIHAGDGQSGPVGSDVTLVVQQDLEVIVYDEWMNPVDGVEVEFDNATNGSWYDADEVIEGRQREKVTSGGGIADCDVWVLGERYGINSIDAMIGRGSVRKVTFNTVETPVVGFELVVGDFDTVAGESFIVKATAMDEHSNIVTSYVGEGFRISGGNVAHDGTEPKYEVVGRGWIDGVIEYVVTLYRSGGPVRIVAEAGGVRSESEDIEVRAGIEDEIEIHAGDGQSGSVGSDVTLVGQQDLEVIVYDKWMNPADGVEVEFGNATNGSWFDTDEEIEGQQREKVTSGGGIAGCDVWVIGERYGINRIDAMIGRGSVRKVTFSTVEEPVVRFEVDVWDITPVAGEQFTVMFTAKDEHGNTVMNYEGEGFKIVGGSAAPDGTEPEYEAEGEGWDEGVIWYKVTLYRAGGPVRIVAEDGGVRSESEDIEVRTGIEDEIAIHAGDGQSGPVGSDVTLVGLQDLEVIVYDEWMNPVDGVEVEFGNATNGSRIDTDEEIEGQQREKVTSGGGIADCDVWVIGERYGINRIDAMIGRGSVRKVTFFTKSFWTARYNTGLIYNISPTPLDFESYQGGIGGKYFLRNKIAYRGLLVFQYTNNTHSTSINLGNSIEYHFINSRVSPYVGWVLDIGYTKVRSEIDSENWNEEIIVPVDIGPILGVEFVILDYLSLFVEYKLTVTITNNISRVSVAGNVTRDKSSDFSILSGLGNDSKIGLIVYINRFGKNGKVF